MPKNDVQILRCILTLTLQENPSIDYLVQLASDCAEQGNMVLVFAASDSAVQARLSGTFSGPSLPLATLQFLRSVS